mmetsp:Transcript_128395/g.312068  ORF Transcript_128395/g.312068 Transcript_128395/m.312068 type:complete len:149 (-) Transcript_128395:119-565(-)
MGRVRTKTVKRSARYIIEKYYSRLTLDFAVNKRVIDEVAVVPSKRMRNKIAGYVTHLMKRIQRGPVRGISLKLQEAERERRLDFVPEVSAIDTTSIDIDPTTKAMLAKLDLSHLPGLNDVSDSRRDYGRGPRRSGPRRDGPIGSGPRR